MGLLEKAILLAVGGALSFFLIDRYSAALDEREARQTQLWQQIERLEQASLAYQIDLYDAYRTPCGEAGHKSVRRLQDEDFRELKLEVDRMRHARPLLFDEGAVDEAHQLAARYWDRVKRVYRAHVTPRLRCSCPDGVGRLAPLACEGDQKAFERDFRSLASARGHLMNMMYDQYRARAARSMLQLVWSR